MSLSITACLAFTPPTYEAEDMATPAPQDLPRLVLFPGEPKTESSGLNVNYTMFLPDGAPGIAQAKLQDATLN